MQKSVRTMLASKYGYSGSVAIRKLARVKTRCIGRSGGQCVELVCRSRNLGVGAVKLPFLDHVHRLDSGQ